MCITGTGTSFCSLLLHGLTLAKSFYGSTFHWSYGDLGKKNLLCFPISATSSLFRQFSAKVHQESLPIFCTSPNLRLGKSGSSPASAPLFCWNDTLFILIMVHWLQQCRINFLLPGQLFGDLLHVYYFMHVFPPNCFFSSGIDSYLKILFLCTLPGSAGLHSAWMRVFIRDQFVIPKTNKWVPSSHPTSRKFPLSQIPKDSLDISKAHWAMANLRVRRLA